MVCSPLRRAYDLDTDVCANFLTAKLPDWFGPPWHYPCGPLPADQMAQADGLAQSWKGRRCWMNPPYTNAGPFRQALWLDKARSEARAHSVLTVGLVPARTGTRSWRETIWDGAELVVFVTGRLTFEQVPWTGRYLRLRGYPGLHPEPGPAEQRSVATFSTAVVIWATRRDRFPEVRVWDPTAEAWPG